MLTNPQPRRVDERFVSKKLAVSLTVIAVILSLAGDFYLFSYRSGEQSAVSGQLLEGGEAARSSFMSYFFDYFGSVTYLFPWLSVYIVILLIKGGLRQPDMFKLGLRLLGINTLLLGVCMLFSGIISGDSLGAGGILGDYLNMASFAHLPRYVAPFVPVVLTYAGIMLCAVHSPLWFCDALGAFIMSLMPFASREDVNSTAKEESRSEQDQKVHRTMFSISAKDTSAMDVKQTDYAKSEQEQKEEAPRFFRGGRDVLSRVHIGTERPTGTTSDHRTQRVEPSFGVEGNLSRNYEAKSSSSNSSSFEKIDEVYALNRRENTHERTDEKEFSYGNNHGMQNQPADYKERASRRTLIYNDNVAADQKKDGFNDLYERTNAKNGVDASMQDECVPSTIISGVAYANADALSDIYDGRYEDASQSRENDKDVCSTIITKSAFDNDTVVRDQSSAYNARRQSDNYKGPVYKAGAPGANNEVVGNPANRGEVSTVITRGQNVTKMQFGQSIESYERPEESPAGNFNELKSSASLPSSADVFMPQDPSDENATFTFTEENGGSEQYDDRSYGGLRCPADPISEHDQSFSHSYIKATRGLGDHAERADRNIINDENCIKASTPSSDCDTKANLKSYDLQHENNLSQSQDVNAKYGNMYEESGSAPYDKDEENSEDSKIIESVASATSSAKNSVYAEKQVSSESDESEDYDDVPVAPLSRIPTKDYVCSVATVPSRSDINDPWRPAVSLLQSSNDQSMVDEDSIRSMIAAINRTFVDFNVQAEVAAYQAGPVITRYDLKLGRGTRTSSIRQLQTDISRSLTTSVRVIDVVPGTSFMGLEIPNPKRKFFTLRDVVETAAFKENREQLPLCLGVNAVGQSVIADLATAPHLLIAGTTGSGKSAGINSMMLSLLLQLSPAQLRFMLIDPKTVEFSRYEDLPHLICPVITDMDKIMAALQWCVDEMQRRYELIANLKFRSVSEYNAYIKRKNDEGERVFDPAWSPEMGGHPSVLKPLPAIVIVIDEFADLMAAFEGRGKNKDASPDRLVQRIAQKARAASMHLMVATQSPRSSVITGTLKANLPSRIAYTVQSGLDSRVILDEVGAENLLGNGDMLAKFMGLYNNQLFRAHGPFASGDDVKAIVNAWKEHCGEPEYLQGVTDAQDDSEDADLSSFGTDRAKKLDPLYETIVAFVRDYQNQNNGSTPSITQMQVEFGIGYPRTKKILAQMKRNGDL